LTNQNFCVRLVDLKNEENNSVLAGRSLLLSSQFSRGRFDPFSSFLRPATQAKFSTSENTNNFTLLYTQLTRDGKSFIFAVCRLPFAVNVMLKHLSIVFSFLKLSNSWSGQPKYCFKFAD